MVAQALAAVRDYSIQTVAAKAVQERIRQRVAGFPASAKASLHRAHAVVPRSVAAVLRAQPQLVAPAVEAFYSRDDDDLKVGGCYCMSNPGASLSRYLTFACELELVHHTFIASETYCRSALWLQLPQRRSCCT